MNKADYEGRYRIKSAPIRSKPHNAESWTANEKVVTAGGGVAEFDALSAAVEGHEHGSKTSRHPYQFITYCIRRGWLVRDSG